MAIPRQLDRPPLVDDSTATVQRLMDAIRDGRITFQAGGGIVADSDPAAEYTETLDKARALIEALRGGR